MVGRARFSASLRDDLLFSGHLWGAHARAQNRRVAEGLGSRVIPLDPRALALCHLFNFIFCIFAIFTARNCVGAFSHTDEPISIRLSKFGWNCDSVGDFYDLGFF